MKSNAETPEAYLAEVPEERREALRAVRELILKTKPKGVEEGMQYGMIGYFIPHEIFPAGYHCDPEQPLPFASIANQKNHMSLYMMFCYGDAEQEKRFKKEWEESGKKLDMGKACVRFKSLDDLPMDVIGRAFKRTNLEDYIDRYVNAIPPSKRPSKKTGEKLVGKKSGGSAAKKTSKKTPKESGD